MKLKLIKFIIKSMTISFVFGMLAVVSTAQADPATVAAATAEDVEMGIEAADAGVAAAEVETENGVITKGDTDNVASLEEFNAAWLKRIMEPNLYIETLPPINEVTQKGPMAQALSYTQSLANKQMDNKLLSYSRSIGPAIHIMSPVKLGFPNSGSLSSLTSKQTAADSLSLNSLESKDPLNKYNDEALSFDTLMSSPGYNILTDRQALKFIKYITKSYENPSYGIDFHALNTVLGESSIIFREKRLHNIIHSSSYKDFQIQLREHMAMDSLVSSNLYYLYALRKRPLEGEGNSPLENQNHDVAHMAEGDEFYEHLKTASPTSMVRDLAQMELHNTMARQQSQQTDQRLLAVLSTQLELSLSDARKNVAIKGQSVNQAILGATIAEGIK